ncbi:hypothetical protein BDD12DRAFT_827975 [Trichophaea hybrida]|nr:hypothetical protein BDD12DRAFT_827975 [Trichophaea hybrida]
MTSANINYREIISITSCTKPIVVNVVGGGGVCFAECSTLNSSVFSPLLYILAILLIICDGGKNDRRPNIIIVTHVEPPASFTTYSIRITRHWANYRLRTWVCGLHERSM